MAAQDLYGAFGSVPTAEPTGGGVSGPLNVGSTPNSFGAQVGESKEQLGASIEKVGMDVNATAMHFQDIQNTSNARNIVTGMSQKIGDMELEFMKNRGLNAATAYPVFQKQMNDMMAETEKGISNPAVRAAVLNDGATYVDRALTRAGGWTAGEVEKGHIASLEGGMSAATNEWAAHPEDAATGTASIGRIRDGALQLAHEQGLDKSGADALVSHATGKAYHSIVDSLLYTKPQLAIQLANEAINGSFDTTGGKVPYLDAGDKALMAAKIAPIQQGWDIKGDTTKTLAFAAAGYGNYRNAGGSATGGTSSEGVSSFNLGNVKTAEGARTNTAQFEHPATAADGVILAANNLKNNYSGLTLAQIADKWAPGSENNTGNWLNNVSKASGIAPNAVPNLTNPTALKNLLTGIAAAEKSPADRAAFTPEVLDQGVQAALSGQKPNLSAPTQGGTASGNVPIQNPEDWMRNNSPLLRDEQMRQAQISHPNDPNYLQKSLDYFDAQQSRSEKRIEQTNIANGNILGRASLGVFTNGERPTSWDKMDAIDPDVRQAHVALQGTEGGAKIIEGIERMFKANLKEDKIDPSDPAVIKLRGKLLNEWAEHPEKAAKEDYSQYYDRLPATDLNMLQGKVAEYLKSQNGGGGKSSLEVDNKRASEIKTAYQDMLPAAWKKEKATGLNKMLLGWEEKYISVDDQTSKDSFNGNLVESVLRAEKDGDKKLSREDIRQAVAEQLRTQVTVRDQPKTGGFEQAARFMGSAFTLPFGVDLRDDGSSKQMGAHEIPANAPPGTVSTVPTEGHPSRMYIPSLDRAAIINHYNKINGTDPDEVDIEQMYIRIRAAQRVREGQ